MLHKGWAVRRCWHGQASVMKPQIVGRYWTYRRARRVATQLSLAAPLGAYYEVVDLV